MTNLDKVIKSNKSIIIELISKSGFCISQSNYKMFRNCNSCTNKCRDCINGEGPLIKWLKKGE